MYSCKESDWRRFRKLLPGWQIRFMDKLCKEYVTLLTSGKDPGDTFWELEKRIRKDKRNPGVICELRRSRLFITLLEMLQLHVITESDLEEFSEEMRTELHESLALRDRFSS